MTQIGKNLPHVQRRTDDKAATSICHYLATRKCKFVARLKSLVVSACCKQEFYLIQYGDLEGCPNWIGSSGTSFYSTLIMPA